MKKKIQQLWQWLGIMMVMCWSWYFTRLTMLSAWWTSSSKFPFTPLIARFLFTISISKWLLKDCVDQGALPLGRPIGDISLKNAHIMCYFERWIKYTPGMYLYVCLSIYEHEPLFCKHACCRWQKPVCISQSSSTCTIHG